MATSDRSLPPTSDLSAGPFAGPALTGRRSASSGQRSTSAKDRGASGSDSGGDVGAYWCPWKLTFEIEAAGGKRTVRRLSQPFAVIGSSSDATICVRDERVARRQLYLHATDDGIFCIDLAPPVGIFDAVGWWLEPGVRFELGDLRILATSDAPARPHVFGLPNLCKRGSLPKPSPVIRVERDGRKIVDRTISRGITLVGRKAPCSFRIESRSVSGVHCALYWQGDQMWVIDLLSSGGTLWHRQAKPAGRLAPHDVVQIGNYSLSLLPLGAGGADEPTGESASGEHDRLEMRAADDVSGTHDPPLGRSTSDETQRRREADEATEFQESQFQESQFQESQ